LNSILVSSVFFQAGNGNLLYSMFSKVLALCGAQCLAVPIKKEPDMANAVSSDLIELAAEIVSAYVSNNSVPAADLPSLINDVFVALTRVGTVAVEASPEPQKPAISVKKSLNSDFLICLEDGKKFKSLKRHLRTQYNMSPEQYREKWGLPSDYPMVAPNYAAARSRLAKEMGLGQQRRRAR
jgi:predicted transcriptional regulator